MRFCNNIHGAGGRLPRHRAVGVLPELLRAQDIQWELVTEPAAGQANTAFCRSTEGQQEPPARPLGSQRLLPAAQPLACSGLLRSSSTPRSGHESGDPLLQLLRNILLLSRAHHLLSGSSQAVTIWALVTSAARKAEGQKLSQAQT